MFFEAHKGKRMLEDLRSRDIDCQGVLTCNMESRKDTMA